MKPQTLRQRLEDEFKEWLGRHAENLLDRMELVSEACARPDPPRYYLYLQDVDYTDRDGGTFLVLAEAVAAGRAHIKAATRGKAWVEFYDTSSQGDQTHYAVHIDTYGDDQLLLTV